jgi:hypothetical protein
LKGVFKILNNSPSPCLKSKQYISVRNKELSSSS